MREKARYLLQARAALSTDQDAADFACVSLHTVQKWLEDGKKEWQSYDDGETDFVSDRAIFYVAWRTVKAGRKVELLENIIEASKDGRFWAGAMTLLERDDPESFGRKQTISIDQDVKVTYQIHELDGDAWRKREIEAKENVMDASFTPDGGDRAQIEA